MAHRKVLRSTNWPEQLFSYPPSLIGYVEASKELGHRVIILQPGRGPFSLWRDIRQYARDGIPRESAHLRFGIIFIYMLGAASKQKPQKTFSQLRQVRLAISPAILTVLEVCAPTAP